MTNVVDVVGIYRVTTDSVSVNETDTKSSEFSSLYSVKNDDIASSAFSIVARIISIFLNVLLIIAYYESGHMRYFWWTLCCVVIPIFVTSILQVFLYIQEHENGPNHHKELQKWKKIFCSKLIIPFFFRYYHSFKYAVKSRKAERRNDKAEQKKYYQKMIKEDSDVAFLRIFECFLELAPQKSVQISIMLPFNDVNVIQILAVSSSVISLTWCMVSYQKCIRLDQNIKRLLSTTGTIVQFIWQFFYTISRVLAIGMVASLYPEWTLLSCLCHAGIMSLWIFIFDRSQFCYHQNAIFNYVFSFLLGMVYIYNYIMPRDGRTRNRYIIYYLICGIEALACIVISILFANESHIFVYRIVSITIISCFVVSIIMQIVYYTLYHPTLNH